MNFDETIQYLPEVDQKVIKDVLVLFENIDAQTKRFSAQTGLNCKVNCGACCTNPDIETTTTEVLPLAVYLWSQGTALKKMSAIQSSLAQGTCVFYKPSLFDHMKGRCGIYPYRPGLCRLFGFASRSDKHGRPALVTCHIIKEDQVKACKRTHEDLQNGILTAPSLTAHAFSVADIDPTHGRELLPINQAIGKAIEKVGYQIQKMKH